MRYRICSIYDSKAEAWQKPMCFMSGAQAVRSFGDAINGDVPEFQKHPEDYTLFDLGVFDEQIGKILVNESGPESLAVGVNLVRNGES